MTSFQISLTPSRRAAARFVTRVRREVQKALAEENAKTGITQSEIARKIGVHRSVIHREIRGNEDLTLGRLAELAWALGRQPLFLLREPSAADGSNIESTEPEPEVITKPNSGVKQQEEQSFPITKAA